MKRLFLFFMCLCLSLSLCACGSTSEALGGTGYDKTKIGWGLKKVQNSAPEVPKAWVEMLKRYDGYYLGNTEEKVMYLTFDEGYENGYTAKILDVLKKHNVPAAFFVTGPYLKNEEELIKRMVDEGHIVGNHTVNHPSMPEISDEKALSEIKALNKIFESLTGQKMTFFRPPKGEFSENSLAITQKAGYKTIFWSVAYADWDTNKQKGTDYAVKTVTGQFHNGAIILLHAVSEDNAKALDEILTTAKTQGYTFKSLEDL